MHRVAALAVLLAVGVSGCSAAEPEPPGPCGDAVLPPGVAPYFVQPGTTAVSAEVGGGLYFVDGMDLRLSVDDPTVVRVLQPRDDGSAQYTAGGRVLAPGRATITATDGSGQVQTVVVTAVCATPR